MTNVSVAKYTPSDESVILKELILRIKRLIIHLTSKWRIILMIAIIGALLGYIYAYKHKTLYTATLSFVLEDEKNSVGGGLSGAMGLASSLGIDLGVAGGGAFSGANLTELIKSRTLVEKALLNPITVENRVQSFASYFIEFNRLDKTWNDENGLKKIQFEPFADKSSFTLQQDSIMSILYEMITGPDNILSIGQKDKKTSIIRIEVKTSNELFSKYFAESIVKEVSNFYIDTKSKKARMNLSILQRQTDSVRRELNAAITGVAVAIDNTYNLNPAFNVNRTPSTKRQIDVQANTAILTQLIANLEMAKVTLLKETPLIQIIDKPILPLKKTKINKTSSSLIGAILATVLSLLILIAQRWWRQTIIN